MIRVGVIGYGYWGPNLVRNFNEASASSVVMVSDLQTERLNKVRQFDPLLWRMHVEAGVTTGDVQRLARENGLRFPPDPGAVR